MIVQVSISYRFCKIYLSFAKTLASLSRMGFANLSGIMPLFKARRIAYRGIIPGSFIVVKIENMMVKINITIVNITSKEDTLSQIYGAMNSKYINFMSANIIQYQYFEPLSALGPFIHVPLKQKEFLAFQSCLICTYLSSFI